MSTYEFQSAFGRTMERADATYWQWMKVDYGPIGLGVSMLLYVAAAGVFLHSGVFIVGEMLNDTLLVTETGYRIAHGQWPGIHFTSTPGALWFLPHALAFIVTGDLVRSVPIAFVIFAGIAFGLAAYIAWTRLNLIVGSLTVLFCAILVMAPWAIGFNVSVQAPHTTAAMGYNRLGFVLVLLVALLAAKPKHHHRDMASRCDALFAVACFGLAFYVKMTFGIGVAGIVFLWAFFFADGKRQFWQFIIGSAALMIAAEVFVPGLHSGYLQDMIMHVNVQEPVRVRTFVNLLIKTVPEVIAVAGLPLLALSARANRNLRWRYLIFVACLVVGSIVLLSQSTQGPYLVTPLAVAILALSEMTVERGTPPDKMTLWGTVFAFLVGFWTYIVPASVAIVSHALYAHQSVPIENMPSAYASLRIPSNIALKPLDDAFTNRLTGAQAYAASRATVPLNTTNALFDIEYAHTLTDLTNAQQLCGRAGKRTAVLDFSTPSSSLLGHGPVGGYSNVHFKRTFSETAHWPAERMFKGVDCLFDPKLPYNPLTRAGLWLVYGPAIHNAFTVAGETRFWNVLVRNGAL